MKISDHDHARDATNDMQSLDNDGQRSDAGQENENDQDNNGSTPVAPKSKKHKINLYTLLKKTWLSYKV